MEVEALRNSPIGGVTAISGIDPGTGQHFDHYAYLPDSLPETVELSQRTWTAVANAMASLGSLRQACAQLPNPGLLIRPALAKEALSTSALEGTFGTLPEVLEARLPQSEPHTPEVREIRAYETMAEAAFQWIEDRPITIGMLSSMQQILADASRTASRDPGQVREHQVIIGPEHCSVFDARFIPPPPGIVLNSELDQWQRWINEDHDLPVIVRAAMAHYQFETLHPFGDGNGRVGRLVILLQLLRDGVLTAPGLTISPWFLQRRNQYQDHLLNLSFTGDWNPWVFFFCQALDNQASAHVKVAQQLLDWCSVLRAELLRRNFGGVIVEIAGDLIEWPVVTNPYVMNKYGVSAPTAKHATDRLVELGALQEFGQRHPRTFGARAVMELVESL